MPRSNHASSHSGMVWLPIYGTGRAILQLDLVSGKIAGLPPWRVRYWMLGVIKTLSQNGFEYIARDVGESVIAPCVSVGKSFVVNAQKVKHGGMEVMGVGFVFGGQDAILVGGAMNQATFYAASRHPRSKGKVVMFPAGMIGLGVKSRAAKLGGPNDQSSFQHTAPFEIGN